MIFSEALGRLEGLGRSAAALVPGLVIALVLFGVGLLIARGVRAAVRRAAELRQASPGSASVLGRIAGGMTILVSFLVAASVAFPSVSAADLFNLLGIGGVAIGFAFRDVLQNLLAGILILLTRPFVIGDQIRAGSHEGTVEDVWVRATVLRTYDNQRVLIPNATLFVDKITVITAHDKRRLAFPLTIGNGDDMKEARRVIVEALRGTGGVLADPAPEALVTGLGAAGVDMTARFWIDPPRRRDAVDALDHAISNVKDALTAAGIDLPYPTSQVLLHDQTEASDGDRTRQREGWPAGKTPPRARWQVLRADRDDLEREDAEGGRSERKQEPA
ncbi:MULTISPECIES: mechanosensitive ion channel family protein [unclassified Methylobacterium]|uniref:mechanosensitive ion channel family protein n=1 Tax=unclassified Methylobacterium TaxID=2615210 RepID=UPI0011C1F928|nr:MULTISPECIES: mechanosensitive ion channel family protein [unclassified Methylobacterium]QEE41792.1 mechanosensitive ion channel family protein [Methylobacterium sp. WL1]TXN00670.1 mechanosensitive ion channel family protein [Methylobacterium sp. WL64]TXN56083.1 mechanosensitive ion channel family protein [Methylobacterium sp. WL2]